MEVHGAKKEMMKAIQQKREAMIRSAKETGYTSEETIKHSQELDKLILQYQLAFRQSNQKRTLVRKCKKKTSIVWSRYLVYRQNNYSKVL